MMIEVDSAVRRAWQRTLGVEAIGPADDFFVVGGTSLLAARLIAELNEELGLTVGLRLLADNPTCQALADALSAELSGRLAEPHAEPAEC